MIETEEENYTKTACVSNAEVRGRPYGVVGQGHKGS